MEIFMDFLLTSEVFLFNFSVIDESSENWRNLPAKLFCFRYRKRRNKRLSHFLYFWFLGRVASGGKRKEKTQRKNQYFLYGWKESERARKTWHFRDGILHCFSSPVRSTENWIICQNIYVSIGGVVSRSAMTQDFFVSILGENPSWNFPPSNKLAEFSFYSRNFLFVSQIFVLRKLNQNFHNHSGFCFALRKLSAKIFFRLPTQKKIMADPKFSLPFYRLEPDHFKNHSADD